MKIQKLFIIVWLSITVLVLAACNDDQAKLSDNLVNNVDNFTKVKLQLKTSGMDTYNDDLVGALIPPAITLEVESRNSRYYTSSSDSPYYIAVVVKSKQNNAIISSIALSNNIDNTFEIAPSSATNLYGSNLPCTDGIRLDNNNFCELLLHLAIPGSTSTTTASLTITSSGVRYQKTIVKTAYAYMVGNFSQVYPNESLGISGLAPANGVGSCGVNQNKPCQIVGIDLTTHQLSTIATTNHTINNLVQDNTGNLYVAGDFTSFSTNESTIIGPESSSSSSLIIKLDPASNMASDFIKQTTNNLGSYPNGSVYAMTYNTTTNKLYIAGGFNKVALLNSVYGYPVVQYDMASNTFSNAFGIESNNPDAAVTAIGFDANNNLYLSGFYSRISNFPFNDGYSKRSINKCVLSGNYYNCLTGTDYSIDITSTNTFKQPAFNLDFQPDGGMYVVGGFFTMSTITGTQLLNGSSYVIAYNSLHSTISTTNSWVNLASNSNSPDNAVGFTTLYDNGKFYVGGQFSAIGNIPADNNSGGCGVNETKSCLLARFDGTSWQKILTTDGIINDFITIVSISAN